MEFRKNGNLRPELFGINSNDRVWWRCSKCGHEWRTTIIHRAGKRNSGCSECAKEQKGKTFTKRRVSERGSLVEKNPALAAEWHPTKNGELTPADVTENDSQMCGGYAPNVAMSGKHHQTTGAETSVVRVAVVGFPR